MTRIYIGKNSGFCFGVKRAIDKTMELLEKGKVKMLGYVIHNEQAMKRLKEKGAEIVEDPEDLPEDSNSFFVIRTHGVKREVYDKLRDRRMKFFDATCPFVIRSQRIVERFSQQGYSVVVFGDPNHPEVIGILSFARNEKVFVVQKPEDVERVPQSRKFVVVSQTTQKLEEFTEVVARLIQRGFEIRVFNTVCDVTIDAQREAREIARMSDVVVVIGGRMSSNTEKLYDICSRVTEAYKIEMADDIHPSWFVGKNNIGIVAGTSTPDWIIKNVVDKIIEIKSDDHIQVIYVGRKNKFSAYPTQDQLE